MKPINSRLITFLSLLLVVFLGAGSAFAQGKGKGGGGGNRGGGGGGGHQRGGGPPQGQVHRPQQQVQRQQMHAQRPPQAQRQQHFQRAPQMRQHPQMQRQHPQMQRQMHAQRPQWSMPNMQRKVQRQQHAVRPNFERGNQTNFERGNQKQQVRMQADRGRGQAIKVDRGRGKDMRQIFQNGRRNDAQQFEKQRDRGNEARQALRNSDRNRVRTGWDDGSVGGGRAVGGQTWDNGYKNYGQQRKAEVHARNAERKAWQNSSRTLGGYFTGGDQYRDFGSRIYVRDADPWRDNILRSVVVSVLANDGYSYSPWNTNGYYDPYHEPRYANYYEAYPVYSDAYSVYSEYYYPEGSYYNFYSPYYVNDYVYTPVYYGGEPYYGDYFANDLGLPYLSTSSSVGGFVGELFGDLVAYGYNQGYRDAMYARSRGYNTRYYDDPYDPYVYVEEDVVFEDVGYNPYSCFGLNRRYVSEGYELGYRDAIYGETEYDPYDDGSNIDLVSVMISAISSLS